MEERNLEAVAIAAREYLDILAGPQPLYPDEGWGGQKRDTAKKKLNQALIEAGFRPQQQTT